MTAAAARKLTKEIDNVLKKVDDGLSEFDEFFELATAGSNSQQKERLGEELKKSINKLQRLRAQMREWIGQSSVPSAAKDKLEESRRRIENDMQRFKEFERDLKTKAFSTCALAKDDELDLEEAEKMKYQEWLTTTIQALSDQLDCFEADLEALGNKKTLSNDDKLRQTQLKDFQDKHRWHSQKLELLLRATDNDAIELSDLAVIRESVEYYVESHEDQDYYHDEGLYDCFDLTEYELGATASTPKPDTLSEETPDVGTPVSSMEPSKKGKDKEAKRKADKKDKKKEEKDKKTAANSGGVLALAKSPSSSSPHISDTIKSQIPLLDQLDLDEEKVQEDQLLSEAEEFICKICQIHVVGCSPKLTSCSHLFCGDCIAQWFNQHPESQTWAQRAKAAGPDRVVPCPVCKQPLNEKRDLYPVCGITSRSENLLLWRMLSSLKIMCANNPKASPSGKCEWIGEYGSYQKHIKVCKNLPGPVPEVASPEAPALRIDLPVRGMDLDASSVGESSATGASCLTTPAVTPAMVASSPPPARVSPLTSPVVEPKQAPRTPPVVAQPLANMPMEFRSPMANQPVTELRSPMANQPMSPPQARPAPAIAAPVHRASEHPFPVAKSQVTPYSPMPVKTPLTVAPAERPVVSRKLEAESIESPVRASAPLKTAAQAHDSKAPSPVAQRSSLPHQDHKAASSEPEKESSSVVLVFAVSSFEPTGTNMVHVKAGDRIQVLEQHGSGWTYCKNLDRGSGPSQTGWVPSWISQAPPTPKATESRPAVSVKPKGAGPPVAAPVVSAVSGPAKALSISVVAAPAPAPTPSPVSAGEGRSIVRATATFSASASSQLSLAVSELVEIVERHSSGWTFGRKVVDAQSSDATAPEGWFPDWVVVGQPK